MSEIDWANTAATLISAVMGGWIASNIAKRQADVTNQVEQEKLRKEAARELIESMDSFLHIAYRGTDHESRMERQRLRRRIQSLAVLSLPDQFVAIQDHLDLVEGWWRSREGGPRVKGVGVTATESFFDGIKSRLFKEVFKIDVSFNPSTEVEQSAQEASVERSRSS